MTGIRWETCIEAAQCVPATSLEEEQSWICRNLAEVALMAEIAGEDLSFLDEFVGRIRLSEADPRFCKRLAGLRRRQGPLPDHYPRGGDVIRREDLVEGKASGASHLLCRFADLLDLGQSVASSAVSALGGNGKQAESNWRQWRPGRFDFQPSYEERPDIPKDLLWRGWMSLPNRGATMVVVDERLDSDTMEVWWGVHNGTHLDHLSFFPEIFPTPIEFGSGLLIAESLAMCAELLAGAEALIEGKRAVADTIRKGLIERVGRLRLPDQVSLSPSYEMARQMQTAEFNALPTLSGAYVLGAVALIARDFQDPLIPFEISKEMLHRWGDAANQTEGVRTFLNSCLSLMS
jgi:hypothetical protein